MGDASMLPQLEFLALSNADAADLVDRSLDTTLSLLRILSLRAQHPSCVPLARIMIHTVQNFGHAEALELEKLGVQVDWDGVEIFDEEEENPSDSGGENGDD